MKLFFTFLFITILNVTTAFSQVGISTSSLNFGSRMAYQKDSLSVTLTNTSGSPVSIGSLSSSDSAFSLRATSATISANSSQTVWVRIYSVHNINYSEKVYISIPTTLQTFSISVTASVNYAESVYNSTQNKFDSALLTALTSISASGHNALGYDGARTKMFSLIDDYNSNDNIECVYTGRIVVTSSIPSATGTQSMNTEHTWPQSMFGSSNPMVSDLHHLYPTDATANNRRSNYPFGIVSGSPTWENAGSKLGTLTTGGTGFEPRDVHKGNVARSMFYFVTRYKGSNANYGGFYSSVQDAVFRKWNKSDPVDSHEMTRNNSIETYQGNRNPFIDHPEFADRIHDFINSSDRVAAPKFSVSSTNLKFGSRTVGQSYSWMVKLGNTGTSNLTVSSITSDNAKFVIENSPTSISTGVVDSFKVIYTPTSSVEIPAGKLTVASNAGSYQINLNSSENGDFNNNGSATGQTGSGTPETGTTNPPSTLSFSSIQSTFLDVSWFEPSGYVTSDNDFIVLVSTTSFPSAPTGSINSAVPNVNFSLATPQLGSSGKLVFKGDATSFTLTGLVASTTYYVSVFTVQGESSYSTALESSITTSETSTGGGNIAYGQDFEGWSSGASYTDYLIPGTIGTGDWKVTNGYKATGTTSGDGFLISGASTVRLRNAANSAVTSPYISEGIGDITFKYRQWDGAPSLDMFVETSPDAVNWTTIETVAGFTSTSVTSYNKSVQDQSAKYFRVRNSGGERLMIDDIQISVYGSVTPVELTSFTAQSTGSGVKLLWSTATETNNFGFDVEKSADNLVFSKVGFVDGNGTTSIPHNYEFVDDGQLSSVWYRLKQIDTDSNFTFSDTVYFSGGSSNVENLPGNKSFRILGNYPNPFNPGTEISYQLSVNSFVTLKVFDLLGREITTLENIQKNPGKYDIHFDATKLTAGIYIYQLRAGNIIETRKMMLVK